jgi:eukaryotic-like serine/threonine-protein kinase
VKAKAAARALKPDHLSLYGPDGTIKFRLASNTSMLLQNGTRLGRYEVLAPLGAGGMGEVYRARDTRLDRTVAIKVLLSGPSSNVEQRQRFEREARAVSSLCHPHICTLYDVGQQDGIDFQVMEYLEGETLASRLAIGPLPTDQVLRHAIEICDALDRAHRLGVVHRDLKPSNIILSKSGVKLLDFGLAKFRATEGEPTASDIPGLTTVDRSLTKDGRIVGTLQYMAPEQIEGKEVDARADIFAFGAVLFEMATGRKAFESKSQASLIAAILDSTPPPISTLRPAPRALDHIVERCLAKDPEERWLTAHDLVIELKWLAQEVSAFGIPRAVRGAKVNKRGLRIGTIIFLLVALLLGIYPRHQSGSPASMRFSIPPPEKTAYGGSVAISPDGTRLAFVAASSDGKKLLWARPFASVTAQPLPGTEGASYPFWSPDSRFIGFFASGKLKRIDIVGGLPQTLGDAPDGRGGTWNREGVIVFAPSPGEGLRRIFAAGGQSASLTNLDASRQETAHLWPHFLPDGRHFVYLATTAKRENDAIYAGTLDSAKRKHVLNGNSNAAYASLGYLLFWRDGALTAQRFDPRKIQVIGEAFPISQAIKHYAAINHAYFSISDNNTLVYLSGAPKTQLLWFDRGGRLISAAGPEGKYDSFSLSPDGKRVAAGDADSRNNTFDIWLLELSRGNSSRFTFDSSDDSYPVWSPDGRRIVYASNREGLFNLYQRASSGAGREEILFKSEARKYPTDWSRDGRFLIYITEDPVTKWDLWVLALDGSRKAAPFARTGFDEMQGQFSPDGRWIAYASEESDKWEVYVEPFPVTGSKWKISTGGGADPSWRRDGKELFYLAADKKLMAVEVKTDSLSFDAGIPRSLFGTRVTGLTDSRNHYVVTPDGKQFLVNTVIEDATASPVNVVVNWTGAADALGSR